MPRAWPSTSTRSSISRRGNIVTRPVGHLAHQGAVGPQQELLAGLAPGVKGPGDLGAAEGAVGQKPAVFPGKGNALGHAMVDDKVADLGQAVDIAFPGPEIAALDGVVKEPPDAVAVVGIIFGRIDAALGRDAVGPAGAVLDTEGLDVVAQLRQRGRGGAAGQAGAHHDDVKFSFVGRVDQFQFKLVPIPFLCQGPAGNFGIKLHHKISLSHRQDDQRQRTKADADDHREDNTELLDEGHVLGMVGPHRLKGAPETMPDMQGDDDHGDQIDGQINLVGEDRGGNLKDVPGGLVDDMVGKGGQVHAQEGQDQQAGIGHGLGAEGAAAATLVHRVPIGRALRFSKKRKIAVLT